VKLSSQLSDDHIAKWQRPALPVIDPTNNSLIFQQLDVDHYIDNNSYSLLNLPAPDGGVAPIFRMFGLTEEGHSVVCHIHGFLPYFYVQAMKGFKVRHKHVITSENLKYYGYYQSVRAY